MTRDDNWRLRAACATEDPELFFGPEQEHGRAKRIREEAAVTICARCPVAAMCLKDAVATRDAHGVRGGKTPEEISSMVRADGGSDGRRRRGPSKAKAVIAEMVLRGMTAVEIAAELGKAPGTIRTHIAELRHDGRLPMTAATKAAGSGGPESRRRRRAEASERMDMRNELRDERRDRVTELTRAGLSAPEIAERIGFNEMTVYRDLRYLRAVGALGEHEGRTYQPRTECGSARGWRLHRNARETPCKACDDAVAS